MGCCPETYNDPSNFISKKPPALLFFVVGVCLFVCFLRETKNTICEITKRGKFN